MDYEKYKNKMAYPSIEEMKGAQATITQIEQLTVPKLKETLKPELDRAKAEIDAFKARRKAYNEETARLNELFKQDALKEVGLSEHPNRDRIYSAAWDRGHSGGLPEVMLELEMLAELILV